jgi:hypothetical protein
MRDAATGSRGFDSKGEPAAADWKFAVVSASGAQSPYVASKPHCLQDVTIVGTDQRARR